MVYEDTKEDIIEYLEELLEGLINKDIRITDKKKFVKGLLLTVHSSELDLDVMVEKSVMREMLEDE
jgi:hypothetical protein